MKKFQNFSHITRFSEILKKLIFFKINLPFKEDLKNLIDSLRIIRISHILCKINIYII